VFVGFNLAFLPMHWTGLAGMPRRIYTYPEGLGWSAVNLVTTIGAFILAVGVLLLAINIAVSRKRGLPAGPNPWGGPTLEWSIPSPPPAYDFEVIPAVASRHPLWEKELSEAVGESSMKRGLRLDDGKEMLTTTALDAEPDAIVKVPEDSIAPLAVALAATMLCAGALVLSWIVTAIGFGLSIVSLLIWLWPRRKLGQIAEANRG
jgi:cytochrome c oxidase subunit 1/cytochrome c oxidase subunit I+III